ncbi:MAG: hypothetical protein HN855_08600 [Anaerolineae bacterium]|nr:hypothetical protein [Anaerolineae bacterium]MBT7071677.1 hypothetical protein [Anaerolineae bacterium]MBT7325203.1 hypothetical protein [Anaerolineae bacterium]
MQRKKSFRPLLFFALVVSLGCAVPTLPFLNSAPEAAAPTTVDADTLATLIADSVNQKVSQTLEALPPAAAPTLLPTETPLPSPTATEIPPTATPTQIAYPDTGSDLLEDDEGDLAYFDYTGGYKADLPTDWLAIRPGEAEFTEVWALPVAANPEVQQALQNMQSLDPNTFRLFVLDTQEGHFDDGFLTNINFLLGQENEAPLEEVFAQTVLDLPNVIPGLVVTDSYMDIIASEQSVGIVISEWDALLKTGEAIRLYQKQAIFIVKDRGLVITFTSSVDFKDTVIDDFDTLVNGFMMLD